MAGSSWSNQVETTLIIASSPQGTGLFVYNGTPGLGTLLLHIVAPGVTRDPYGNPVNALMNIGSLTAAHVGWSTNGDEFLSDSTGTNIRQVISAPRGHFLYNGAGAGGNPPTVALTVPGATTDTFGNAVTPGITAIAGSGPFIQGETWHDVSGGSGNTVRVQRLPWNAVWLDVQATWTGSGTTTLGSLPSAAYYPTQARDFPIASSTFSGQGVSIHVPTSGALSLVVVSAGAAGGGAAVIYPTN